MSTTRPQPSHPTKTSARRRPCAALTLGALVLSAACFYNPVVPAALPASTDDLESTGPSASVGTAPATTADEPTTTTVHACGDGVLDPGEQCDDGDLLDGDGCEHDCTKTPQCGDGELDPGEQCDDGDRLESDGCDADCMRTPVCGDGDVWIGVEACDDGPTNGEYGACAADCSGPGAHCGDGVRNGDEECDDGDEFDEDDCSNLCIAPRFLFSTSQQSPGNLGGVTGADSKCMALALTAGVSTGATWLAWLSDGDVYPAAPGRFDTTFQGYYQLTDGTVVARGWDDLTDGALAHAIDLDEYGLPVPDGVTVWSAASADGSNVGANNCSGWTADAPQLVGRIGDPDRADTAWSDNHEYVECDTMHSLYCFQNSRNVLDGG